jgi:hypothetical protein
LWKCIFLQFAHATFFKLEEFRLTCMATELHDSRVLNQTTTIEAQATTAKFGLFDHPLRDLWAEANAE